MPVFSSHLLGYDDLHVGTRLREARQERGLSLRELAALVGISAARLSEIENGQHVLDLRQATELARGLALPIEAFTPADARVPFQITREAELRSRAPRHIPLFARGTGIAPHHNRFWPLAEYFIGRHLEPVFLQVMPGDRAAPRFWHHHEEEFFFVLSGTVEFLVRTPDGLRGEEIGRGDCVTFRSSLPHCLRSLSDEPAEVIDVYAAATPPPETGFDWLAHRQSSFVADLPGADDMRLVGERLRTLRDMHGWTVEQVAVVVGISVRRLERIEAGERPVPLDVMLRLARAFGRPVVELVGETQRPPYYVVQRSASIPSLPSRTRQTPVERPSEPQSKTCQPLAFGFPTRHLFPYFIQLRQAGEDALTHHEHHSHEFIYVLDGELELATLTEGRSVTEVLRPGDACYLDSTVPHLVRGRSRNPYSDTSAAVIDVFWSPLGEDYLFHD
jgi:transcriptional regulator with XRE-family HTH domain